MATASLVENHSSDNSLAIPDPFRPTPLGLLADGDDAYEDSDRCGRVLKAAGNQRISHDIA